MQDSIIYDLGANRGLNLPYYLSKAAKVIAVEANPELAEKIRHRFNTEISSGRLVVEQVLVIADNAESTGILYVDQVSDVGSTSIPPAIDSQTRFKKISVPTISVRELVQNHGKPLYVKIDVEGLDAAVLIAMFTAGIRPPFISAEGHSPAIFGLLAGLGGYESFKLVRGPDVGKRHSKHGRRGFPTARSLSDFPEHSAGPFGDDIEGPWFNQNQFFKLLRAEGLGWYDIHASTQPAPADTSFFPVSFQKRVEAVLEVGFPPKFSNLLIKTVKKAKLFLR